MKEYRRIIFFIVIILVAVRPIIARLTDKSVYRGPWYTVKVPEGWTTKLEEDTIYFVAPEKNIITDMPEAIFSIFAQKSKGALFLDTLFIEVMESLAEMDGQVLKKGDIMVDGLVSKWVLFQKETPPLTIMTFYIVDDFNRLTRIQFMTHPRDFTRYRPMFEAFKDSLKFKKLF